MQAYVYYRFSSKKQEKGVSKERQIADCTALAERKGWTISEVFGDHGRSAYTGNHLTDGKLGEFAQRVRSGEIGKGSVLVVEKLDRLSRQEVKLSRRWLEEMTDLGLTIATVAGQTYDEESLRTNIMQAIELLMFGKLAHDESAQKAERVQDNVNRRVAAAKASNKIITRKSPGWLTANADKTAWIINEPRAAVIRLIYELAAEGHGRVSIGKKLNDLGHQAWGASDIAPGTWDSTYIAMILRNPAVEGDYIKGFLNPGRIKVQDATRIVGYYPRIVDADLVARARAATDGRKLSGGRYKAQATNLFAGLIRCGECNGRLHMRGNGTTAPAGRQFQCYNAGRNRGCSQKDMFKYAPFEHAALDAILHLAMDDRFFRDDGATGVLHRAVADLKKAITDAIGVKGNAYKVMMKWPDDEDANAGYAASISNVKTLEQQLQKAELTLERARGAVSPQEHVQRVSDVREHLNDPDPETREAARLRVHEALKSVVTNVSAEVDVSKGGKPLKTLVLILAGGVLSIKFDNDGREIDRASLVDKMQGLDAQFRKTVTGNHPDGEAELSNVLRRIG